MFKPDVLAHFNGNQAEVARVLKVTRVTVNGWPDPPQPIPEISALRLEKLTDGKLPYDATLYDIWRARRYGRAEPNTDHNEAA